MINRNPVRTILDIFDHEDRRISFIKLVAFPGDLPSFEISSDGAGGRGRASRINIPSGEMFRLVAALDRTIKQRRQHLAAYDVEEES